MKEIKVKESTDGTYVSVTDVRDATHIVLELSTYRNLMRLQKEKAIRARGLTLRSHSGYRVISVDVWDEPHSKTRMPNDEYSSWNIEEGMKMDDQMAKLDFLEKRKSTKKIFVPCYLIEMQTPYEASLNGHDLEQVMYDELFKKILPGLGYENDVWPEPGVYLGFDVKWKKEKGQYVLASTVYRIILVPNLDDGFWHIKLFTTAVPTNVPDEMK